MVAKHQVGIKREGGVNILLNENAIFIMPNHWVVLKGQGSCIDLRIAEQKILFGIFLMRKFMLL